MNTGKRRHGSVKFEDYFKVQFWNDHAMAWQDVQRGHETAEDARAAYVPGKRCRVMLITANGRQPLPE